MKIKNVIVLLFSLFILTACAYAAQWIVDTGQVHSQISDSFVKAEYDPDSKSKIGDALNNEENNEYHVFEVVRSNSDSKYGEKDKPGEDKEKEAEKPEETAATEEEEDKPKENGPEKEEDKPKKDKPKEDKPKEDKPKEKEIEKYNDTHVFIVPHPDDEVLSMGAGVIDLVERGKDVHLVLLTAGEGSSAINRVNEKLEDKGRDSVGVDNFVSSRISEFKDAANSMGVAESNLHIYRLPDGGASVEDITDIVMRYEERLSPKKFHAISVTDKHTDHKNAAKALINLRDDGRINSPMFYLSHRHYETGDYDNVITLSSKGESMLKKACHAYNVWDPDNDRYSVGWMSVESSFLTALNYKMNKVYDYN